MKFNFVTKLKSDENAQELTLENIISGTKKWMVVHE